MNQTTVAAVEEYLNQTFAQCDDFSLRKLNAGGTQILIAFMRSVTDRELIGVQILRPIQRAFPALKTFGGGLENLLESAVLQVPADDNMATESLLRGEVLVAVENTETAFFQVVLANAQKSGGRSIEEPSSDVTVKGPKAGFVENAEVNTTELRKYIHSPALKTESMKMGDLSGTGVLIAYIEGRHDPAVLQTIKDTITAEKTTGIVDSGNVEMILDKRKLNLFPITGSSEKVDKVASKLLSGRIAIIVDGSPFVVTAPFVFAESLQSAEDYLRTPFYATFIRCLRFFALIIAVYLPALLITTLTSYNELLPETLLKTIEEMRANLPFSLFWEVVVVLVIFEILREVGVRMPRAAGDAVGIVGSIILGDAAVKAGIASTIVIMVVAMSAVCAFIVPVYMFSTVLLRFVFAFLAFKLGFFGIILGSLVLLFWLCSTNSFGVSYMTPVAPVDKKGLEDFLLAIPKKTLGRKEM